MIKYLVGPFGLVVVKAIKKFIAFGQQTVQITTIQLPDNAMKQQLFQCKLFSIIV